MVDDSIDLDTLEARHKELLDAGWPEDLIKEHLKKRSKKKTSTKSVSLANSAIYINNLSKRFNNRIILDKVSLEIKPGEIFGLIGLSGAGKTTLLNLIVGFVECDSGNIVVKDSDDNTISILQFPEFIKSVFGFSSQYPSFYSKLSITENLAYFGELFGLSSEFIRDRTDELLRLVELEGFEDYLAGNLSGGMQKRLDIACALIHQPDILLLDEPTADLDPLLRRQMWKIIKGINKKGTTVIVASHFIDEIEQNCSQIGILNNKRVVFVGSIDALKDKYTTNFEIKLRTASRKYGYIREYLSKNSLSERNKMYDGALILYTSTPKKLLSGLFRVIDKNKDSVDWLDLARPSLKEAFEALVKS